MKQENIRDIFACRLRLARKTSGLSMAQLSSRMNGAVSRQAINKYENGKMLPSSDIIIGLGDALGVKYDYFFSAPEAVVTDMAFKSSRKLSESERQVFSGKIQMEMDRYLEIERILGAGKDFTTTFYEMTIKNEADAAVAALRLRCDWGLGDGPLYPVFDIMEKNGVKVISVDYLPKGLDGIFCNVNGKPLVIINSSLDSEKARFTAFHELGHGLLRYAEGLTEHRKEQLCDAFSRHVLLPSDELKDALGQHREWIHLEEIKILQSRFGIPADSIIAQARELNIISRYSYSRYRDMMEKDSDYSAKVGKSVMSERMPSRMRNLVLRAYGDAEITESKAANLLNESVTAVHRMPLI